jgi:hypothetical protein
LNARLHIEAERHRKKQFSRIDPSFLLSSAFRNYAIVFG